MKSFLVHKIYLMIHKQYDLTVNSQTHSAQDIAQQQLIQET